VFVRLLILPTRLPVLTAEVPCTSHSYLYVLTFEGLSVAEPLSETLVKCFNGSLPHIRVLFFTDPVLEAIHSANVVKMVNMEVASFNDMVFVGSTSSTGKVNGKDARLLEFLRFVQDHFDVEFIAKMDIDVFLCPHRFNDYLTNLMHTNGRSMIYAGVKSWRGAEHHGKLRFRFVGHAQTFTRSSHKVT
jgi:hypothetical protein